MAICIEGPKVTIDGISLDAAELSLNNMSAAFDTTANPDSPGAAMYADDPHTSVDVPGDNGPRSWPVPAQSSSEAAEADRITRKPAKPAEPIEGIKLPDGIKYSMKISKYLTLGDLSAKALYPHHLSSNVGFTVEGIATNLKALSTRVLDPIFDQYGVAGSSSYIVNSGFRPNSGGSRHNRGRAADLQWPGQSESFYFEVAKFVQDNLEFDQVLLEKATGWWIHVAYSLEGNTSLTGINPNATSKGNWRYGVKF